MILNMTGGAGSSGKSDIIVYAATGSTVYIENQEGQQKTAGEKNGVWTFKGCGVGTWTVHASLGDQSATSTVEITEEGQLMRYEVTIVYEQYLYNEGIDNTELTGGWQFRGLRASSSDSQASGTADGINRYVKNTEDHLEYRTATNSSSGNSFGSICEVINDIDLSNFTKLKMIYTLSIGNGAYIGPSFLVMKRNAQYWETDAAAITQLTDTSEKKEAILDISSISGEYDIAAGISVKGLSKTVSICIYSVWLE